MEPDRFDWTALVPEHVTEEAMTRAIANAALPPAGEPYSRTILLRNDSVEVLLAAWGEGARSAPHDHGRATGVVFLVRGRFIERTWKRTGTGWAVASARAFDAPARLAVDDGEIHDMEASSGGISLHVYRPCIQGMRVLDIARRETLVVSDDCGAWIPLETRQIVTRKDWRGAL
jgi:predicted metal-dependent enzyme (double-stranded beta helix superfamily)